METESVEALEVLQGDDHWWYLCRHGESLLTPGGKPLRHRHPRLLRHVLLEARLLAGLHLRFMSAYSMLCTQLDFVDNGDDMVGRDFSHALLHDQLLYLDAEHEQSWAPVRAFAESLGQGLPELTGPTGCHGEPKDQEHFAAFADALRRVYERLSPEQRTGVITLFNAIGAGVLLPLTLVTRECTGLEFAEAYTATKYRPSFPPLRADGHTDDALLEVIVDARKDADTVLDYIQHYRAPEERAVQDLIVAGESARVEFKSTLRINLRSGLRDEAMENAVLKTAAAFMNTDGGKLLIGVADDGEILGLAADNFQSADKFMLHLRNIAVQRLGPVAATLMNPTITEVNGSAVCVIDVRRASSPVYLSHKGDEFFFVRTGPSSTSLPISAATTYIGSRF